jgi:hypothetical protein
MAGTFKPAPDSHIEIRGQTGNFNWLNPGERLFVLSIVLPGGAPVKEIEAMWPASDEPRWENEPPSEVASIIYSRTRHYFSTSQDSHRLGARWIIENAAELDRLWARQEVCRRNKAIEELQKEIAALQRDYIDIDEDEEVAA